MRNLTIGALAIIALAVTAADPLPTAPAQLKVFDCQPVALASSSAWRNWPPQLTEATIFEPTSDSNNEVRFEVMKPGLVLLAASWVADGTKAGNWRKSRATAESLVRDGWKPIGAIERAKSGDKPDAHTLYFRHCREGETIRLHTRKVNPPRVLLVPEEIAAALLTANSSSTIQSSAVTVRTAPRLATTGKRQDAKDFTDRQSDGCVLVGLRVSTDYLTPRWGISSIQPIYERADGRFSGQQYGQPGSTFIPLEAPDGYAVGGMIGSVRGNLAGLRLLYMRRTEQGVDASDICESRWVGARSNAEEAKIGGDGHAYQGIQGKADQVVRALELIPVER